MIIKAIRYTVYILVYVVLILISGLLNIVIFKELDWTILLSAEFWLEMVVDYTPTSLFSSLLRLWFMKSLATLTPIPKIRNVYL